MSIVHNLHALGKHAGSAAQLIPTTRADDNALETIFVVGGERVDVVPYGIAY